MLRHATLLAACVSSLSGTFGSGHTLAQTKQHTHTHRDQILSDDRRHVGSCSARLSSAHCHAHTHKTLTLPDSAAHSKKVFRCERSFWLNATRPQCSFGTAFPTYLSSRLQQGEKQEPVEPLRVLVRPELQPVDIMIYIPTVNRSPPHCYFYDSPKPLKGKSSLVSF